MTIRRETAHFALAFILLVGLSLRLSAVSFGLPSLYDPDEPMFMLVALKLLTSGSLNPGWFGHPGSTTIYLVAIIDAAVAAISILSGHFASIAEFTKGVYADPSLLFIPARVAMALLGTAAVWLAYDVTRRLSGQLAGLVAAGLLAVNSLHVAWSAIVRTDIHSSVFMLACLAFAIRAAEEGRLRDYLLAGLFAGFATATKWPAASIFVTIVGAAGCGVFERSRPADREARNLSLATLAFFVGVFIASPFIFLDWRTVLADVTGEFQPGHLAHSGHGFLRNIWWYVTAPIADSMGIPALLLVLVGLFYSVRHQIARWTIVPAAVGFLVLISDQKMIWSRWILPALPMFAGFAGIGVTVLGKWLAGLIGRERQPVIGAVLTLLAAVPAAATTAAQIHERSNDTRIQASRWAVAHIPPGSTIVLEHLELSFLNQPWKILFPVGQAGCLDARRLLQQKIGVGRVKLLRAGSPIVDLGNVSSSKLESCRANYAILTYYDLYLAEKDTYPEQIARYEALLRGGKTVALFRPRPGYAGGPVVRVVAVGQQ